MTKLLDKDGENLPLRKKTVTVRGPSKGSLSYHLDALDVGESHYIEVPDGSSIVATHGRIQSSMCRLPESMRAMKFTTQSHTAVPSTIGDPVRYVIRITRLS